MEVERRADAAGCVDLSEGDTSAAGALSAAGASEAAAGASLNSVVTASPLWGRCALSTLVVYGTEGAA